MLLAVCLGLRAGEVVSRAVRDIDTVPGEDAEVVVLRICDNESLGFHLKTGDSKRAPELLGISLSDSFPLHS